MLRIAALKLIVFHNGGCGDHLFNQRMLDEFHIQLFDAELAIEESN